MPSWNWFYTIMIHMTVFVETAVILYLLYGGENNDKEI